MSGPHQIARKREDVRVTARDLLATPAGDHADGLYTNLSVQCSTGAGWTAWLRAHQQFDGDAATAEISRAQVWSG